MNFLTRLLALPFLIFGSDVVLWLFGDDEPKPRYSGDCGNDTSLTPYDRMTTQEHDEAGGMWAVDLRDRYEVTESK